jgi:hypothetical protein
MRYRSATVAGSHGLSCFPKVKKNVRHAHHTPPRRNPQDQSGYKRINA